MSVPEVPATGCALLTQRRTEFFAFEAPFLEEKMLRDGKVRTRQEYQEAFSELKKYLWLTDLKGGPLPMISRSVDEVWHQFILFTREYSDFCIRFFGTYRHHSHGESHTPLYADIPAAPDDIDEIAKFLGNYRGHFGPVPRIWFDWLILENENLSMWFWPQVIRNSGAAE